MPDGEEEDKKAENREADHPASRGLVPAFNLSNINCMYFNKKCLNIRHSIELPTSAFSSSNIL